MEVKMQEIQFSFIFCCCKVHPADNRAGRNWWFEEEEEEVDIAQWTVDKWNVDRKKLCKLWFIVPVLQIPLSSIDYATLRSRQFCVTNPPKLKMADAP